ncbi:MAG: hypothetical protein IBGAMO2_190007 [Arenicellales bacterium IbO2]|nr:MAG: hypothetical protein IBGAMO2_190007 [Arenicellales bacterium IbO2]
MTSSGCSKKSPDRATAARAKNAAASMWGRYFQVPVASAAGANHAAEMRRGSDSAAEAALARSRRGVSWRRASRRDLRFRMMGKGAGKMARLRIIAHRRTNRKWMRAAGIDRATPLGYGYGRLWLCRL